MVSRFVFFFLFIFSTGLSAQEAFLQWTESIDFERSAEYNEVVGVKGDVLYVISSSNQSPRNSIDVYLNRYDKSSLEQISSFQIVSSRSDVSFEKLTITENDVQVFSSYFDRNLGFQVLTVQPYDEASNTLLESMRVDEVVITGKEETAPFHIATSPDLRYLLIQHKAQGPTGNAVFNLKVINEDFTSMWEKAIEFNYKERMVTLQDLVIDNNSNVYLLTRINPYGIKRSSGFGTLLNLKNTLFIYQPYQDKLKEFEFALTRNWIQSVIMRLDENQNMLATAFYTYPNDYKLRGFVQFKISGENGEVLMKKMTTLNKESYKNIEQAVGKLKDYSRKLVGSVNVYPGSSSHMNNTSTEFILKDMHYLASTVVLSVEALRRDERCTESFNEQQMIVNCEKHFLYGNIILFFLDYEGNIRRIENIEKMQHSVDRISPYYSFYSYGNSDKYVVAYNDHFENFYDDPKGEIPVNLKALSKLSRSKLKLVMYDGNGNLSKTSINRADEEDVLFFPRKSNWLNSTELLLYSQKEKNYKFGKLKLPK